MMKGAARAIRVVSRRRMGAGHRFNVGELAASRIALFTHTQMGCRTNCALRIAKHEDVAR